MSRSCTFAVPPCSALGDLLRRGELDAEGYLAELERRHAEWEPRVFAFVEEADRWERVRRELEALGRRHLRAADRPPLFGVTLGVKDIFQVEGLPTRAGSRLPIEELAGEEAESVRRLRAAGAIVVGKTATTEFAYFAPGPTRNPHDLERTPGGSSSGSAAAVAAGLCDLALGTQTIASLSRPASYCGVVAYKPAYERIARDGVIPLAPSLDHVGLFARSVEAARRAAEVLCHGWRPNGSKSRPVLGVPAGPYLERAGAEAREHLRAQLEHLERAGFEVRSISVMADFEAIEERHHLVVAAEAARVHARWWGLYRERYHERTTELIVRGLRVTEGELAEALRGRHTLRSALEGAMAASGVDLLVCPGATGPAPRGLERTGDPVMSLPFTHAGLPTLCLPAGPGASRLPLGLQLVAPGDADERLFAWAVELERVLSNNFSGHLAP